MKKPRTGYHIIQRFLPSVIRRSYALKLAAIFVLLGITLGTMGLGATYAVTENVQDSSNTQFAETASQESRQVESWLQNYYNIARIIADDTSSETADSEQVTQQFRSRILQFPSILAIHYVNTSDDRIVASTDADLHNDSLASVMAPWTDELNFDGQRDVSSPYTSRNVTRLAITQRVEEGSDRVVVLELETRVAAPTLGSTQANLETGYTEVVTGGGQVVFSERPSRIGTNYGNRTGSRVVNTASSAGVAGTTLTDENPYIRDELRSDQYLVGYDRVEGTDWVVVKHARQDTVYGFAQSVFSVGIAATGVLVVLIGLLGVFVGRNTSADIDRLVDKANEMEQGNLTVNFATDRIDNIGRLYLEFDRTQQALREQIEQSKLIEHSYDLITVIDPTGFIRYQSPSAQHIIGLDAEDIEGEDIFTLIHDEDTATVRSAIQRATENPQSEQRFAFRVQNAAGEWRYFEAVCENHIDDPFVEGLVLSSRDTSELKESEQELKELNTRLELALEETDTGVWEWDLDTDEVVWDETSERLFGYDAGEFPGEFSGFADRVPEDDLQRVRERVDHAIKTGEQYRAEFRVEPPTEDQRWVQARGVVEYDADDEPERVLGVQTDITERKERERQLQRQNERLDQFAGAVSHDLRNPLMVALARLDMIRDGAPEEHVETMERNLERMEEMIDDLLTLARIDQHTKEFERVTLAGTARDAWEHADVADCEFESSIPESATVKADRNRLLHIFENLFRNAADHNDVPLTVRVGMLSDTDSDIDGGQRTGFFIEDNGTGIPDEQRDEIFDRGHTTSAEGTGFGLSIVRDIVTEHGWDIRVTDGADGGARFEITGVDIEH